MLRNKYLRNRNATLNVWIVPLTGDFFVADASSSEESESEDDSFFLLVDADTGVDTAGFFTTGVTGATTYVQIVVHMQSKLNFYLSMQLVSSQMYRHQSHYHCYLMLQLF